MKKNYFMLAAATMMLAACAKTDLVNEVNVVETPQAIGFETFAQKATRAETTETTIKDKGFRVWGYKYPNTAGNIVWVDNPETTEVNEANFYTVFDEVNVTWDTGKWGYTDPEYWDRTSKYNFYAVAPATPSGAATYEINQGYITINNVASAKSSNSDDYVIDRDGNVGVDGAYTGTEHTAVDLDFHHVMSKLSFQLKAAVPEEITINSLTMSGWNEKVGNFTQKLTTKPSTAADITEWSIPTASTAGSIELVGASASDNDGTIVLDEDMSTISKVTDEYIMVPQAIAAETLTFTISFTIDGEKFVNQVGKLKTVQTWGTDAHITYTISVGPDVIDFNVTNVCGFDAGSAGPNLEIE